EGLAIPIWILGSSTDSAYLAAQLGLPYAFAAHFAPAQLHAAIRIYKENFQASKQLAQPYVMACVNVIAADQDEEADLLATSLFRMFLDLLINHRSPLMPPAPLSEQLQAADIQAAVKSMIAYTFTVNVSTLKKKIKHLYR